MLQLVEPAYRITAESFSDGGIQLLLRCVMRLPTFPDIVGFIHAASQAGWEMDLPGSQVLIAGQERLPALSLRAAPDTYPQMPDAETLLSWYASAFPTTMPADDDVAVVRYRNLDRVSSSRTSERYNDGHIMITEVGALADGRNYTYRYATTGFRRLELTGEQRRHT